MVLIAQATPQALQEAGERLAQLRRAAETAHIRWALIHIVALQALLDDALGQQETAATRLGGALELAEPGGFIRTFVDLGPSMARLLARVRWRGGSRRPTRRYVDRLLGAFGPEGQRALAGLPPRSPLIEPLTQREREVLVLLGRHLTNVEIAEELVLSPATVKTHTLHIYRKLDVRKRQEAVARAKELGML
jgi:LuxR family maltose regulon positive regulatory protein